jgi:hypothetical protein
MITTASMQLSHEQIDNVKGSYICLNKYHKEIIPTKIDYDNKDTLKLKTINQSVLTVYNDYTYTINPTNHSRLFSDVNIDDYDFCSKSSTSKNGSNFLLCQRKDGPLDIYMDDKKVKVLSSCYKIDDNTPAIITGVDNLSYKSQLNTITDSSRGVIIEFHDRFVQSYLQPYMSTNTKESVTPTHPPTFRTANNQSEVVKIDITPATLPGTPPTFNNNSKTNINSTHPPLTETVHTTNNKSSTNMRDMIIITTAFFLLIFIAHHAYCNVESTEDTDTDHSESVSTELNPKYFPGQYILETSIVMLTKGASIRSDKTRTLSKGTVINIVQIEEQIGEHKIRGKLVQGDWVTIKDTHNSYNFSLPYDPSDSKQTLSWTNEYTSQSQSIDIPNLNAVLFQMPTVEVMKDIQNSPLIQFKDHPTMIKLNYTAQIVEGKTI